MIWIGTSGWQYDSWKHPVYEGVPQKAWLEHYTELFDTVELNNAFYRLPETSTFEGWRERTPDGFVMAVKMSRYLTHIKRLKDPEEPVERFLGRVAGLGDKLGPVLVQLPPNLEANIDLLRNVLQRFPKHIRVAVEFRHDSWFTDETRSVLEDAGAALVLADKLGRKTTPWRTTDWGFVRFHEGQASPHPCYGTQTLKTWAEEISNLWNESDDVFVYFNNDPNVCAVRDAGLFANEIERLGRACTKTPDPKTVKVGSSSD